MYANKINLLAPLFEVPFSHLQMYPYKSSSAELAESQTSLAPKQWMLWEKWTIVSRTWLGKTKSSCS